jgi:amino acid transporter
MVFAMARGKDLPSQLCRLHVRFQTPYYAIWTTGIIMALDTFGPISDNAQGFVEMAGIKGKAENVTGGLDAVGNI